MPKKPEDDGFSKEFTQKGRDKGYELGLKDSENYANLDDNEIQKSFADHLGEYIKEFCPNDYDQYKRLWFGNGLTDGYEKGVNVPYKKLNCGEEEGKKFVDQVKKKFGPNIHYTKETRADIENFVRPYLNDINNIPEKYRGMLYKRWYVDSFRKAVRNELLPPLPKDDDATSVEDCDNVLKHILARLIEFLYISVYRETTFKEIFANADPNVFLEAVGISKVDFEVLNKYKIFEENTLNNCIHEFFVNESIGETLDLSNEEIRKQYRNSFNWFGFGIAPDKQ